MQLPNVSGDRCAACPIRHRAVCATCDDTELAALEKIKYYRSYTPGQPIMWRGDPMDYVASVVVGTARLERTLEDGRKQMVGLLLPSDFIGRPGREVISHDVTAVTDVTLCCFRRKPFERMLNDTPHLSQRLMEMALDELDAARDWMLLLGRKTAREKIASLLLLIHKRSDRPDNLGHQSSAEIELPLTREDMSNYLGLTLETVSRQFSKLKKEGLIVLEGNRTVMIPDPEALRLEAEIDDVAIE